MSNARGTTFDSFIHQLLPRSHFDRLSNFYCPSIYSWFIYILRGIIALCINNDTNSMPSKQKQLSVRPLSQTKVKETSDEQGF